MTIDTNAPTVECAATQAISSSAKAENLKALAELSASADSAQQADHIRGIVATTVAHLSANATAAMLESTAQWQAWALALSDSLALDVRGMAVKP